MRELTLNQATVVATLLDLGESYGHEIGKAYKARVGKSLGLGTLYKILHSLEKQGYLRARWEEQPEGEFKYRRRRYYEVDGLGEQALDNYRAELDQARKTLKPLGQGF